MVLTTRSSSPNGNRQDNHLANVSTSRLHVTVGQRLRDARIKAGYKSAEDAAIALGIAYLDGRGNVRGYSTYAQHESGLRSPKAHVAEHYARHFGVTVGYLLAGEVEVTQRQIPVLGVIGAKGKVLKARARETLEAPPSEEHTERLGSFRIGDAGQRPFLCVGDHIVYDRQVFAKPLNIKAVDGRECIVQQSNCSVGVFIFVLKSNGWIVLHPHRGPVIRNARVQRAAPVEWIRRAQNGR